MKQIINSIEETKQLFLTCKEWDKFRWRWQKKSYKVAYRNERFVVIVKPAFWTVVYSIIDTVKRFMWPHDRVFSPFDLTKKEDIIDMVSQLLTKDWTFLWGDEYNTRISQRRWRNLIKFDKYEKAIHW